MSNRSYYEKKRTSLPVPMIPESPEWPKLIGQLVRAGVSKVEIAEHIGVAREGLYGIYSKGSEPKYSTGVKLLALVASLPSKDQPPT